MEASDNIVTIRYFLIKAVFTGFNACCQVQLLGGIKHGVFFILKRSSSKFFGIEWIKIIITIIALVHIVLSTAIVYITHWILSDYKNVML